MEPIHCIQASRHGQEPALVQSEHQYKEKADLSDYECATVVGARQAGVTISESADLLGYFPTTITSVYRGLNGLLMPEITGDRILQADRTAQITTCYNCGVQKSISECSTHQT